jgi:uncharacterized membrane protein
MSYDDISNRKMTFGQKFADGLSNSIGSWSFIVCQSTILLAWIFYNIFASSGDRFDAYPFIFLNLVLSFQAAYTGPVLLMTANRQAEIDRARAIENLRIDRLDHKKLLTLSIHIDKHFDGLYKKMNEMNKNVTTLMLDDVDTDI